MSQRVLMCACHISIHMGTCGKANSLSSYIDEEKTLKSLKPQTNSIVSTYYKNYIIIKQPKN